MSSRQDKMKSVQYKMNQSRVNPYEGELEDQYFELEVSMVTICHKKYKLLSVTHLLWFPDKVKATRLTHDLEIIDKY